MFDTVGEWLDKMELKYQKNEEKRTFVLPYDINNVKFMVIILVFPEKWIKIGALILRAEKVTEEMYLALLQENWNLFEVTYSVDEQGNIFSENDIPHTSNYENFVSEFQAVIFGVINFFEKIAPKFQAKAVDTYNSEAWV
ncbi:MAG: hypothetical protein ACTSVB_04610 [Candidatus Heimdallarchaeaceae archaeon]|uniref:Uncharacterized protein n=1 Tax=Candidatus Heimdallarchaeum endolithica TaxID=2876572 RepID=A0A9Y1FNK9_9ARCH|nr:MAG: hypothetical protein K9W46_12895 [Candidatus Heimdallarchaeum endolithica]